MVHGVQAVVEEQQGNGWFGKIDADAVADLFGRTVLTVLAHHDE